MSEFDQIVVTYKIVLKSNKELNIGTECTCQDMGIIIELANEARKFIIENNVAPDTIDYLHNETI